MLHFLTYPLLTQNRIKTNSTKHLSALADRIGKTASHNLLLLNYYVIIFIPLHCAAFREESISVIEHDGWNRNVQSLGIMRMKWSLERSAMHFQGISDEVFVG